MTKVEEARNLLHWGEPERDMNLTHIPESCGRCRAMLVLFRAERVRVLEDLGQRFFKEGYTFKTYEKMLSEARGASGMVGGRLSEADALAEGPHGLRTPADKSEMLASSPVRPPSEEPAHDWPGSNAFVPEHLRAEPEREKCPTCNRTLVTVCGVGPCCPVCPVGGTLSPLDLE